MVQLIEKLAPERGAPVLDLGCFNSEILWALHDLGYTDLHGCDLNPLCEWMPYWTSVHYKTTDMTQTGYSARRFRVLTAVSAIEHGVPIGALAREANRLLQPGGIFLLTTDYDGTGAAHDTSNEVIFGQNWTIFSRPSLQAIVEEFRSHGLEPLSEIADGDWDQTARPVTWNGHGLHLCATGIPASGREELKRDESARLDDQRQWSRSRLRRVTLHRAPSRAAVLGPRRHIVCLA